MFDIFDQAKQFRLAMERCLEEGKTPNGKIQWLPIAGYVNGCFSCELYLKGVIIQETGKEANGHKLEELYDELPPAIKCKIESKMNDHKFREQLGTINCGFVEWRYIHEKLDQNHLAAIGFLKRLLQVIEEEI